MAVTNKIANTTDDSKWTNNMWHLQINANEGYKFEDDASAAYTNDDGYPRKIVLTKNKLGTFVYKDVNDSTLKTDFVITGQVVDATNLTIDNQIPNTTYVCKKVGSNQFNLTITAVEGYVINTAKVIYNNDYGYPSTKDMTISHDGLTATYTASDSDSSFAVSTRGTTSAKGSTTPNIINNIVSDVSLKVDSTYLDNTLTIKVIGTLTPKYRFINPKVNYTNVEGREITRDMTQQQVERDNICQITLNNVDIAKDITLSGSYENVTHVNTHLTNCTINPPIQEYYTKGAHISITLKSNQGTEFNDNTLPSVTYQSDTGVPITKYFDINQAKDTATINVQLPLDSVLSHIDIIGEAFPIKVIGIQYGSINVYKVTIDNLNDFAKKRFFDKQGSDPSTGNEILSEVDLGNYVHSIKRLYIDIQTSSTDVLRCGNYNTEIQVYQPKDDVITLDFGNVVIPTPNGNSVDYDSKITLFLPFVGFVDVSNDYVGKAINVTYTISTITCKGVVKLSCDNIVFAIHKTNPSQDIIYRTSSNDLQIVGGDDWSDLIFYGLEPYVLYKSYTSINNGYNNTYKRAVIGECKGFNVFDDISTITAPEMLSEEQEQIYNLLQRGVIIE